MSNFNENSLSSEELSRFTFSMRKPESAPITNDIHVDYDSMILQASQSGENKNIIGDLVRQEMTEIANISESRSDGVFNSLYEAVEFISANEDEARQYTEFISSREQRGYIFASDDEVLKIERITFKDAPVECIYTRKVKLVGHDFNLNLKADKNLEQQYSFVVENVLLHHLSSDKSVIIGQRMPVNTFIKQSPDPLAGDYLYVENFDGSHQGIVTVPALESTDQLSILLHEIGHGWDIKNRGIDQADVLSAQVEQSDKKTEKLEHIKKERNAWAWAIREARRLRDLGFIVNPNFDSMIEACAEYCLSSYDVSEMYKGQGYYTNMMRGFDFKLDESTGLKDDFAKLFAQLQSNEVVVPFVCESAVVTANCKIAEDKVSISLNRIDTNGESSCHQIRLGDRSVYYSGLLDSRDNKEYLINDSLLRLISMARVEEGGGAQLERWLDHAVGALSQLETISDIIRCIEEMVGSK